MQHNYVISLTTAIERRKHIEQEFGKQDIPFEFFDAITPSEELDYHIKRLAPSLQEATLSLGEKACFISHLLLWEKCINENMDFITIFEDDVILGDLASQFFTQKIWLYERFDFNTSFILNYETDCDPVFREDTSILEFNYRKITKLNSVNYGTAGYLISKVCAKELLSSIKSLNSNNILAIDYLIFKEWLNKYSYQVFQIEPAICIQEDKLRKKSCTLHSQLENGRVLIREKNAQKKKTTLMNKLYRLMTKIKRMKDKREAEKYKKENSIPFK